MRLDELARAAPQSKPLAVPDWTLGAFHRRCITYATGQEDTATRVIWLQSHGLTGDLRIPTWRPDVSGRAGLGDCTREELAGLASAEGGVAVTGWSGEHMSWGGWAAFQPYDKWPEPGVICRIGACLIEFAPSGVYVEDWRLQPGGAGLLAGLRLVSETEGGVTRTRDGGLVVVGDQALFVLDRRRPLPDGRPVQQQILDADDPHGVAAIAFDFQAALGRRQAGGDYEAVLALDPFSEGRALPIMDGFEPGEDPGVLVQTIEGGSRCWTVDTLVWREAASLESSASADALLWLERESSTLLRGL